VPDSVKSSLSNIKSVLRSKKRKRRKAKAAAAAIAAGPVAVAVKQPKTSVLETLEEQIDDCLTAARNLDKEGLEEVIRLLRKARNVVVWKIGQ
jgi:DNA-binding MurR/RpiR family transcriptional regulator